MDTVLKPLSDNWPALAVLGLLFAIFLFNKLPLGKAAGQAIVTYLVIGIALFFIQQFSGESCFSPGDEGNYRGKWIVEAVRWPNRFYKWVWIDNLPMQDYFVTVPGCEPLLIEPASVTN